MPGDEQNEAQESLIVPGLPLQNVTTSTRASPTNKDIL